MSSGNIDRVSSGIVEEGINDAPFRVTVMEHIDRPFGSRGQSPSGRKPAISVHLSTAVHRRLNLDKPPVVRRSNGLVSGFTLQLTDMRWSPIVLFPGTTVSGVIARC